MLREYGSASVGDAARAHTQDDVHQDSENEPAQCDVEVEEARAIQSDAVVQREKQEVEMEDSVQCDDAERPLQVIEDDGTEAGGVFADTDTTAH